MKVAVLFGSFNPIHVGHLAIAERFLCEDEIDEVWLSVSPQNPWKEAQGLMAMEHRVAMAEIATQDIDGIKVVDFEKDLPQPSYTYEALSELKKNNTSIDFALLIGGDNCGLFDKWRNYEQIISEFEVWAYPRPGADIKPELANMMKLIEAPLFDISSTEIRSQIAQGQEVNGINKDVLEYIIKHKLNV